MDRKLLQKHIDNNTYLETICPKLKEDGSNSQDFFCADVVGNRRFAQNYGGYPRSEIAEINAAATMQEQQNLLAQLNDYTPSSNPNAGLTDTEIMLSHKSKYQQTATEMQSWIVNQINIRDAKANAEKANASSDSGTKISFEENNENQ